MEMDEFRQRIERKIDKVENLVESIKEQVIKTNGRVSKLELWKAGFIGAMSIVLFIIGSIFVPIIVRVVSKMLNGG